MKVRIRIICLGNYNQENGFCWGRGFTVETALKPKGTILPNEALYLFDHRGDGFLQPVMVKSSSLGPGNPHGTVEAITFWDYMYMPQVNDRRDVVEVLEEAKQALLAPCEEPDTHTFTIVE